MISVVLYHSPSLKNVHACGTIMFVAIFVSPISNSPTDSQNMVSALVLSMTSCFFLWVYHFMGKKIRVDISEITDKTASGEEDDSDAEFSGKNENSRSISIFTNISKKPFNYSVVKTTEENDENMKETELSVINRKENLGEGEELGPVIPKEIKSCRKRTFSSIVYELQLTIIGQYGTRTARTHTVPYRTAACAESKECITHHIPNLLIKRKWACLNDVWMCPVLNLQSSLLHTTSCPPEEKTLLPFE